MEKRFVILGELADEYKQSAVNIDENLLFSYGKRKWLIKTCLAEDAPALISIIAKYEKTRTKKLCFRAIQIEAQYSTLVFLQKEYASEFSANKHDMELAAAILPILFYDYTPTLEFEVLRERQQRQRELKSYVTTQLYNALYCKHQEHQNGEPSQLSLPDYFTSNLRRYQTRTVNWMLSRERQRNTFPANYIILRASQSQHQVYKHKYCLQFYPFEDPIPTITLPPGGILADEMGLGKTVELLATLLLNPRNNFDNRFWINLLDDIEDNVPLKLRRMDSEQNIFCICTQKLKSAAIIRCTRCRRWQHKKCVQDTNSTYICPQCWIDVMSSSSRLVEARSTIIVSPSAIKSQWLHEISKHISSSLKVLLYPGLFSGLWISPMQLASYDIVLTDFSVLTHEIHFTQKHFRQLRYEKRNISASSPLLMVNWWRVCLDEAQMVESNKSQMSEMVRKLPAVIRWAVTGTPIQRSIDDLMPLLSFIGYKEACVPKDAWQTVSTSFLLKHKMGPLLDLLQQCMWRTCKSKVEEELGIPPQSEIIHRIDLSNVESLYYCEEHSKCTNLFLAAVSKHTRSNPSSNSCALATISPMLLRSILQPFLRIRKTCSVPLVSNKNVNSTNFLNPQDLLAHLKSHNEVECKRELRSWASSHNGIASIHFIRKQYDQAIRNYMTVLRLAEEYNGENISVDSLLQIHAIHNMVEASGFASEEHRLTNEQVNTYRTLQKQLESKYLEEKSTVLWAAWKAYEGKLEELRNLERKFDGSLLNLFAQLIETSVPLHYSLWNKVSDEVFKHNCNKEKLNDVSSMSGILYYIHNWHNSLMPLHAKLIGAFEFLKNMLHQACGTVKMGNSLSPETLNFIRRVSNCHLAVILDDKPVSGIMRVGKPKRTKLLCRLCQIREDINKFECMLFAKEIGKVGQGTEGSEHPSVEIVIIKAVFAHLRIRSDWSEIKNECKNKLEILDTMQNLVKLQIKFWIEVDYMIKAFDELHMCKMRLQLTEDPEEQSTYRILPRQLDEHTQFSLNNIKEAQMNFTRLCGRLRYLKHLKEDSGDQACPICQTQDVERYAMLSCGHFLCQHCVDSMMRQMGRDSIKKCPLCRQDSLQLYYSVRKMANNSKIVGDYSTKITHIVESILNIQAQCKSKDQEKVLIFSQWASILNHIANALRQNGIEYRSKFTNRDIDDFKNPELNVTCLLMPLARGSKGLNLIEATHVFLVEPILTPGEELQAIGRVHRFGQTKKTTVHRFVVNGTIEENIMQLIQSADNKSTLSTHWDLDNMTLDSLKNLFILKDTE